MIVAGIAVGVAIVAIDSVLGLRKSAFRLHVMPIAVGIYLPLSLSVPIILGGLLHAWLNRKTPADSQDGLLFGSGLIAGEALMGIGLAIPATFGMSLAVDMSFMASWVQSLISVLVFGGVFITYLMVARGKKTAF